MSQIRGRYGALKIVDRGLKNGWWESFYRPRTVNSLERLYVSTNFQTEVMASKQIKFMQDMI